MQFFVKQHRPNWDTLSKFLPTLLAAVALPGMASAASLNVYLSAPGQQSTYVTGATTETFNSLPVGIQTTPYASAIGTYEFSQTNRFAVLNADQYGGANNSKYVSLGAQSSSSAPVTLNLNANATYFGFWWSAGDPNNGLSFYYNNTLVTRLTTADIVNLLSKNGGNVTAIDGNTYSKSSYYGNPNNGRDTSEPFSYVNVFATGTGFNKIVFDNSGMTSSGFETDNHSIYLGAATADQSSVFVESVAATHVSLQPEPANLMYCGAGVLGFAFLLRRRKRS